MDKITSGRMNIKAFLIEDDKLLHVVYLLVVAAMTVLTIAMLGRGDSIVVIAVFDMLVAVFGVIWISFIVLFHIYQEKLLYSSCPM